uniref:Uncharacterized protein n=1 Tax=viral metagenome TaxID=1070528 RepID=A0A6C0LWY3_9ZZZZ
MEVLREFKKQMILFFDELIDQFPDEGDLVVARLFISNQVPIVDVMNDFNLRINKDDKRLRKMIAGRRDDFFLKNTLFKSHASNQNHFKKIWCSGVLDEDDKTVIWQWVDTFIFLGDKYAIALNSSN